MQVRFPGALFAIHNTYMSSLSSLSSTLPLLQDLSRNSSHPQAIPCESRLDKIALTLQTHDNDVFSFHTQCVLTIILVQRTSSHLLMTFEINSRWSREWMNKKTEEVLVLLLSNCVFSGGPLPVILATFKTDSKRKILIYLRYTPTESTSKECKKQTKLYCLLSFYRLFRKWVKYP